MSKKSSPRDELHFRRLLARNLALPLGLGFVSSAFFVAVIYYLLSVYQWGDRVERGIAQGHEALRLVIDMETGMRGFLLTNDERFLEPFREAGKRYRDNMTSLRVLFKDTPLQMRRLERIEQNHQRWLAFAERMFALYQNNDPGYMSELQRLEGKALTDEIRQQFAELLAHERQLRMTRSTQAERVSVLGVSGFILVILLLSALIAWLGRRELLRLATTYREALQVQADHSEQLRQQAWLRGGRVQLGEALIGQNSFTELGTQALAFFARYLDMAVGALYVHRGGRLQRVATYAFDAAQADGRASLRLGEGLVGEVARERRMRLLENLPDDYLQVSSAIGQGRLRTALIVPLEDNRELHGVLELGFLRSLRERDQELLGVLSGVLGSALAAMDYRQRLQEALAGSQRLNEELHHRQEELRASNQELEEHARALKESQASLEAQQAELEQSNEQLAEQAQMLERNRDQLNVRNHDLQQAQCLLEARAEELQRASRYKSEFLANMSHELRTPLNSSLILAKLLSDNPQGNLTAEQVKYADSIHAAGKDLLLLINDILDLSKVEAGKLDLRLEPVNLARLAETLCGLFAPLAEQKGLQFEVRCASDLPISVTTDGQRLEQVLKNLLSNACKFTEQGKVLLSIERDGDQHLRFAVTDTGPGIEASQQLLIFEAFRQGEGPRPQGGTGLGLSISRELARLLQGELSLVSEPGHGSCFTLRLPLVRQSVTLPEPQAGGDSLRTVAPQLPWLPASVFPDDRQQPRGRERCVLVIEDEPLFAQILYELAHELNYRCLVAQGAAEGQAMARTYRPDAILLDMRLPDRPGLSVLERLKHDPLTRHIPVHVVSVEDRKEVAEQMGAVGYAQKPVSREELKAVFARLEARMAQQVKRVLLVEHDAVQRDSVIRLIADDDIEIHAVARGEEALQRLREQSFDCMIVDLDMPDIDGGELLARMAGEELYSFPPVIVYTGRELSHDEEAQLLRYSRSIIIKGARSPERLLDEVTLFLHKVEADMPAERQKILRQVRNRDKAFEGRTILVADDDVRNIFALTSALEHKGATVQIARNGREAVDKVTADTGIDLVLMDIMMPEMDGYEATAQIRRDPRFARLPIIVVTAKAMKNDQERCLQAGANDYLAKPIDLDRLFSLIRVWLPRVEAG
ncbi:response regulator [Serpens gallinarum]|uniref:histidine kinase n=1 Tax=Serpens gallinarum TaxID=2763075 RepID=A0ABR8TMK7_9PSED|nr:response regulator [Serpens gallinarum]MBD7976998.1 response regulator [Serpens gallinarum]